MKKEKANTEKLHPDFPVTTAHVKWAVREEMARSVEDFLARRTRCLLLNAAISIKMADRVAEIMAGELGKNSVWQSEQIMMYRDLAAKYSA